MAGSPWNVGRILVGRSPPGKDPTFPRRGPGGYKGPGGAATIGRMTMTGLRPDLSGQVAVVTGAGRGIGRAVAVALAGCGAHVALAARTARQIDEAAAEIRAAGGAATAVPT